MQNLSGTQLGPYRLIEPIGEGGMATVYRAYQPSVDRFVALKVLPAHYSTDPNFLVRFKQEARIIARLEHPNIIPVHDFGEQDGVTYLVMRYLQAGSLKEILRHGPLALADTVHVMAQVSSALDYAHRQGVIHRDIKPANILIDSDGNTFLTDFGIAKMLEGNIGLTATGGTVGTPAYMSPEQSLGEAVDARSDIYSLGVMLYETLTGRAPFDADTPVAVILKHLHEPLPLPRQFRPDIPEQVERVVLRAMAKNREDRFTSASEMAAALDEAFTASTPTRTARASELRRRAAQTAMSRASSVVTQDMREGVRVMPHTPAPSMPPLAAHAGEQLAVAESGGRGTERALILVAGGAIVVAFIAVILLFVQSGRFQPPPSETPLPTASLTPAVTFTATRDAQATVEWLTLQAVAHILDTQTATAEVGKTARTAVAARPADSTSAPTSPTTTATSAFTLTPTSTITPDHQATADRATLQAALNVFASQTASVEARDATETAIAAWTDAPTATRTPTDTPTPTTAPTLTASPQPDVTFAERAIRLAEQTPPLYAEDFEAGTGRWRLEQSALYVSDRLQLPPGGAAICDCWGISEVVFQADLRLISEKGESPEVIVTLGPNALHLLLSPDAPQAVMEREGATLAAYSLAPVHHAAWRKGFRLTVVAEEGRLAAFIDKAPVLAADGLGPISGGLRLEASDAVLAADAIALWDLSPPEMATFDREEALGFRKAMLETLGGRAPDAEDFFNIVTEDWAVEGETCEATGQLGLCAKGATADAVYRPLTAGAFVYQVDVSVLDAGDTPGFSVIFGGEAGPYALRLRFPPDTYPTVALERWLPDGWTVATSGHFDPTLAPLGAARTLSVIASEGAFAAYLDEQPIFYARGVTPQEGAVELWAEDAFIALDRFQLWRFGAPPPVNAVACPAEDDPQRQLLCLWRPGFSEVRREFEFNVNVAAWAPDGRHIVIAGQIPGSSLSQDTHLWVVDVACYHRPECVGEPRPLAHNRTGNVGAPDWSPDGEWIAFHNDCVVSLVRPDGSDLHTVWWPSADQCAHWPTWSPDGTRLAAFVTVRDERAHVVVIDLLREAETTLHEMDLKTWPGGGAWSPDGEQVAFAFYEPEPARVLAVPSQGGTPEPLDATASGWSTPWSWFPCHWPRWGQEPATLPRGPVYTPDEFQLRVKPAWVGQCRMGGQLDGGLCIWLPGDLEVRREYEINVGRAAWAPDGRQLVFDALSPGQAGDRDTRLWVADVACLDKPECVGESRPLAHAQTGNAMVPEWSPDGAWIAFHDDCRLSLVRPDGADYHVLLEMAEGQCTSVTAWSPDAQRLATYLTQVQDGRITGGQVVIVNMADGTRTALFETDKSFWPGEMAWSPDGERIAAFFGDEGADRFLVAAVAGGEPEALQDLPDFWTWVPWYWPRWDQRPLPP